MHRIKYQSSPPLGLRLRSFSPRTPWFKITRPTAFLTTQGRQLVEGNRTLPVHSRMRTTVAKRPLGVSLFAWFKITATRVLWLITLKCTLMIVRVNGIQVFFFFLSDIWYFKLPKVNFFILFFNKCCIFDEMIKRLYTSL